MTNTGTLIAFNCDVGSPEFPNLKSGDEPVNESVIRMTAERRQLLYGSSYRTPPQKPSTPPPAAEQPLFPPLKYWYVFVSIFTRSRPEPLWPAGKMIGAISF